MNKDILIPFEDLMGTSYAAFNSKNFNYFEYGSLGCEYNEVTREFIKEGYRFSLPSVGAENCLINYIYDTDMDENEDNSYDFLFFLGNKNHLTTKEMTNLVSIFNEDMDEKEKENITKIVKIIYPAIGYTLRIGNKIISLDLKIDFEKLFI